MGTKNAYAGGTTALDVDDFMKQVKSKKNFGFSSAILMNYCYWCESKNAKQAHDRLLARRFDSNDREISNLTDGIPGFVYVVTSGRRG